MPMTKEDGFQMERRKFYSRREDMSPDGRLTLFMEDDGDVIVTIDGYDHTNRRTHAQAQFCTSFGGGGKSPRVRLALIELARAIEEENEELPTFDGWRH